MKKKKTNWRRLDNVAKAFSVEPKKNLNTFRVSVNLKEKIDPKILQKAIIKTLETYPSYKVKLKSGFFWNYLETNQKDPIVEEEIETPCQIINLRQNNDYLFKVTYYNAKINLDIFHVLTDGLGGMILLKGILYNYLNLKHNLKTTLEETPKIPKLEQKQIKIINKKSRKKIKTKKPFFFNEKSNLSTNKTFHYILDIKKIKAICKQHKATISEYLTALYVYALYKSIYDKKSNKDLIVTVPIDLRRHYNIQSFSNFFTCMNIEGNLSKNKHLNFEKTLNHIKKEYKNKLTKENIKMYLSKDLKLGTNIGIRVVPLVLKKAFMKYFEKFVNSASTTFSNMGQFKVEEQYKQYVDNVFALVNSGNLQKVKCTVCSYENKLTVTLNSNLINNHLEKEFYELLIKHIGKVNLITNTK